MNKLKRMFDVEKGYLKKYNKVVEKIVALDAAMQELTDEQLQAKTQEFLEKLENGTKLDDLVVETFAVAREAASRTINEKPFEVQLLGALALYDGNIAEMKTGEGKTLTSAIVAYTWALEKKGVHVVTVNDYLARRDAEKNGLIYGFLGLTVGLNYRELTPQEKRDSYAADITYTTNSELGFDYLRDNMVMDASTRVIRSQAYVLIDEVDSILIDEARTPLIISGSEVKSHHMYSQVDSVVKSFHEDKHFKVNIKDKNASLLSTGIEQIEGRFSIANLYDVENSQLAHAINQSLKANYCMHRDVDYVVKGGKVIIVDQFTGRTMEGRTYSDGLHQALEAKEHLQAQKETRTMATITYQNFFRLYDKLAGMTGTAKTEEEEFQKTYYVDVISIPTNVDVRRIDRPDMIYKTKHTKLMDILKLIQERHKIGQPILVGTVAIESSEEISKLLQKHGVKHQVLNAKLHEQEAEIIARAGHIGAVTIATNMAGRGTDIKLSDEVKALGSHFSEVEGKDVDCSGLLIVGTERHESRRIDNQLRGRSGRQGDMGESIFFVSFEDDLSKRFMSPLMQKQIQKLPGDEAITSSVASKAIRTSQKTIESVNYDIRKNLLKYDDVLREQREVMYEQRDRVLLSTDLTADAKSLVENFVASTVLYFEETGDTEAFELFISENFTYEKVSVADHSDIKQYLNELCIAELDNKIEVHQEAATQFFKAVMIKVIDEEWINHIDEMQVLREAVGLRGYGQVDPLQEYQQDGREMFEDMIDTIEREIVRILVKGRIQTAEERKVMVEKMQTAHASVVHEKTETVKVDAVGRNELCPCGSGKKYKHCHGA